MIEIVLITLVGISAVTNAFLIASSIPNVAQKRRREILFDIAYSLVWEAERVWGKDIGNVKKAHVKAKLYVIASGMTMLRNNILSEAYVNEVIEEAVSKMQEYMKELNR